MAFTIDIDGPREFKAPDYVQEAPDPAQLKRISALQWLTDARVRRQLLQDADLDGRFMEILTKTGVLAEPQSGNPEAPSGDEFSDLFFQYRDTHDAKEIYRLLRKGWEIVPSMTFGGSGNNKSIIIGFRVPDDRHTIHMLNFKLDISGSIPSAPSPIQPPLTDLFTNNLSLDTEIQKRKEQVDRFHGFVEEATRRCIPNEVSQALSELRLVSSRYQDLDYAIQHYGRMLRATLSAPALSTLHERAVRIFDYDIFQLEPSRMTPDDLLCLLDPSNTDASSDLYIKQDPGKKNQEGDRELDDVLKGTFDQDEEHEDDDEDEEDDEDEDDDDTNTP